MADDARMHGGNTPGMVGGRGHERHEAPVTDADRIGQPDETLREGDQRETEAAGSTVDPDQSSALGGDVATRSGVGETPED